jgi:hypothetical protein
LAYGFVGARLAKCVLHTALSSKILSVTFPKNRRPKDHWGASYLRSGTQSAYELVPIHGGHENIRDHQVRAFGRDQGEGLSAIRGLPNRVATASEDFYQQAAVAGVVVDD